MSGRFTQMSSRTKEKSYPAPPCRAAGWPGRADLSMFRHSGLSETLPSPPLGHTHHQHLILALTEMETQLGLSHGSNLSSTPLCSGHAQSSSHSLRHGAEGETGRSWSLGGQAASHPWQVHFGALRFQERCTCLSQTDLHSCQHLTGHFGWV